MEKRVSLDAWIDSVSPSPYLSLVSQSELRRIAACYVAHAMGAFARTSIAMTRMQKYKGVV